MTTLLRLSWREGVTFEAVGEGGLHVQGADCRLRLRLPDRVGADARRRLTPPGEDEDRLAESILESGGAEALTGWYYLLQRSARRGLLRRTLEADGRPLATLLPTGPDFPIASAPTLADQPFRLSRFAYLRREEQRLVLESPRSHARVALDDELAAPLICSLARPATAEELAERGKRLPTETVTRLLGWLAIAGLVERVGDDRTAAEPESPAACSWEFHDLLFHARSRRGRTDAPFGATYRMEPPPALKPVPDNPVIPFVRPEREGDEPEVCRLTSLLERRRSIREYGTRPITDRQLGEFLDRVARVKATREVELETPRGPVRMDVALRPYPSQ